MAKACVAAFLGTDFAGGRHQRRVDQLSRKAYSDTLQDSD
jgi:ribose 5-phosphate isomerase B